MRNLDDNNIGYYKVLQFSPAGMESYQEMSLERPMCLLPFFLQALLERPAEIRQLTQLSLKAQSKVSV